MIYKIVSSGNFGAEQGGLAAGMLEDLEIGGYAPKGFLTNQGTTPQIASLNIVELQTKTTKPAIEKTLLEADAHLIFTHGLTSIPERRVMSLIKEYGKIVEVVDLLNPPEPYEILSRLREKNISVLHVTGAHDITGDTRIYQKVTTFVRGLIKSYKLENAYKANRNEELEN